MGTISPQVSFPQGAVLVFVKKSLWQTGDGAVNLCLTEGDLYGKAWSLQNIVTKQMSQSAVVTHRDVCMDGHATSRAQARMHGSTNLSTTRTTDCKQKPEGAERVLFRYKDSGAPVSCSFWG